MNVDFLNAASAYGKTGQVGPGLDSRNSGGNSGFASALEGFLGDALGNIKQAENKTITGLAAGNVDLTDIATAIGKAEMTLQAVVAVRDKVISGYQEIMRMPI